MRYIDGFLLPVPRRKLEAYRKLSSKAGKVWREHGALEYRECAGDDLGNKWGVTFPARVRAKSGETVANGRSITLPDGRELFSGGSGPGENKQ